MGKKRIASETTLKNLGDKLVLISVLTKVRRICVKLEAIDNKFNNLKITLSNQTKSIQNIEKDINQIKKIQRNQAEEKTEASFVAGFKKNRESVKP